MLRRRAGDPSAHCRGVGHVGDDESGGVTLGNRFLEGDLIPSEHGDDGPSPG